MPAGEGSKGKGGKVKKKSKKKDLSEGQKEVLSLIPTLSAHERRCRSQHQIVSGYEVTRSTSEHKSLNELLLELATMEDKLCAILDGLTHDNKLWRLHALRARVRPLESQIVHVPVAAGFAVDGLVQQRVAVFTVLLQRLRAERESLGADERVEALQQRDGALRAFRLVKGPRR